jgi:membrane-associated protease RseP (regulator of RpoE activity)
MNQIASCLVGLVLASSLPAADLRADAPTPRGRVVRPAAGIDAAREVEALQAALPTLDATVSIDLDARRRDDPRSLARLAALRPPEARERQAWFAGMRRGIALEFVVVPGQGLVVTDVVPGGPAEAAGIARGDLIVGVDDRPLTGLSAAQVHELLARTTGDRVRLDVDRAGARGPRRDDGGES